MSANTEQTAADLGNPSRRREGVRRVNDLDGWARVLGEGIRQAEVES